MCPIKLPKITLDTTTRSERELLSWCWSFVFLLLTVFTVPALAQQDLVIKRYLDGDRIPISLSGFPSQTLNTLKFDLEIQGFEVVEKGKAEFELTGSHSSSLRGKLNDARSGGTIFHRRYDTGNGRRQAHALADEVVEAILRSEGIARTRIAFRGRHNKHFEIFVSDFDGYNASKVTQDASGVAAPTWIPGKLGLYYTSYKIASPNIVSHDLRSGRRSMITRNTGLNTSAAFSPDGNRIALIMSKSGSPDLYVANSDGSGEIRLTRTREEEACPTWSPDGRTICFTSGAQGGARLYTISTNGGNMRRLQTGAVRGMVTEPDYSPDGKWIAFTSTTGSHSNICVVEANGGQAKVLVAGQDPCWAPNSRTLVFMREKNNRKTLSLLDVPTEHVKDIRQTAVQQSQPTWAR